MDDYIFDFSLLDRMELRSQNIAFEEISSVFNSKTSKIHPQIDFEYLIGYSGHKKFLHIAYRVHENPKFDIEILQAELPNEEDVKEYWCKG